ncbi:hypothetical protein [uncultured Agrobacterium sp.]|uniref:hypothetical protein n=1 Tax=uncultured Agrobacterium sp. TaxID=157277 RepID=UPI0025D03CDC|nr:hypothetical protein [uncultured Agrobacterium sp.]
MTKAKLPVLILHDRRTAIAPGTVIIDRRSRKLRAQRHMPVDAADLPCDLWAHETGWSTETVRVQPGEIEYVEVLPKRVAA